LYSLIKFLPFKLSFKSKRLLRISAIRRFLESSGSNKEDAVFFNSLGKSDSRVFTLMPMPVTMFSTVFVSKSLRASVSIPQTFLPFIKISLTHLI